MQQPLKILHLEDVSTEAELIHRELRKANLQFEVCVVDNKEDYIKQLAVFCPQIILSDHSLPFFNSNEALFLLQETNVHIPFILVTATVSEEFAVDIIKKGATDYILKDRLQRLPSAILKAVENNRLELEHKTFLQEIIANETLMNDAQALASFGSFEINLASKNIRMSNEAYVILGFQPGEHPPSYKELNITGSNDGAYKIRLAIADIYVDLCQDKKDYTLVDKNGRLKFISAEFKIEKGSSGEAGTIKGFLYNITKLKAAENMLQQTQANLKTIFETTDTGYIFISKDQQILSFNKKAAFFVEDQTGLSLIEGTTYQRYNNIQQQDFITNAFEKALAGESTANESSFINRNGETKWYFLRWLPVTGNNNRNHGVILVMSDITERKLADIERDRIAADLITRNNALEQFTYIVSHNLRAPVANIMGLAGILKGVENFRTAETEQFLDALNTSVSQLDSVVNDLNQILRISQRTNEQKQVIYFQQLVEDVKIEFTDLIDRYGAIIRTDFFDNPYTYSVKSFLYNIFCNLVSNSLHYRKDTEKPVIEIKSVLKDNTLKLTFTDNGKGIDLKRFGNKLFGLYQRFDNSIGRKGMGLCIIKALTDNLGGTIKVYSEVNTGTTFIIELPV